MMDFMNALFIILALFVLRSVITNWRFYQRSKKLPVGAKYVPIIGHSLQLLIPLRELVSVMRTWLKSSPQFCIFWLGPVPIFPAIQPKHLEVILGSPKHINKAFQYSFFDLWLGTGLLTSTGSKWHSHRKMITPTFHYKILENFVEVFAEKSQILIEKLEKQRECGEFDIFPHIAMCSLDVICETAMGIEINAQSQQSQSDFVNATCRISDEIMQRILCPWLYPHFLYKLTPSARRLNKYVKTLHGFSNRIIRERKELYRQVKRENSSEDNTYFGMKKKLAFLDLLLETSENGATLTDEEIREEVDTFMLGGYDTITAAISWALQLLGCHPDVQDKVYAELEGIFEDSDRVPTMKDLSEMKYLERVIKEALRLYPSVPVFGRELKEDTEIDGYTVPAGVSVAISPFFTHRLEEFFPNPEEFDPDNFLPERVVARHPYAYIPFSAGSRNCMGQKFAMLEEKVILSYILRHYKLDTSQKLPEPIPELVLRPDTGVNVKLTQRSKHV